MSDFFYDYRKARGITGWQEGDEPAEVTIRRQRDGDVYGLQSELDALRAENARLRNLLRTVLKSCDADAYGYYIYEFPQETYDAVCEVLKDKSNE